MHYLFLPEGDTVQLGSAEQHICQPLHSACLHGLRARPAPRHGMSQADAASDDPCGSGMCLQVDSQYPLWAAAVWAAANIVRWQRSRPVLGPLLDLWWEETRWGHRCAVSPADLFAVSDARV